MTEPRANPTSENESASPPNSNSIDSRLAPEDTAAASLLNSGAPPTDDSPTVISKSPTPALLKEDAFAGGLRGRRLAHFELMEPIGVGGMAAVIRARDMQLDRAVALKILPPEMATDEENVRRFHQEARSAAKLDHENIARVYYCGEDQGLHFIAFEFVEGGNLRSVMEKRGRLPADEAVHYLRQIAAGLSHAADRGVVHRDIKPSNIIIMPTGQAKLVDMGLARSREKQQDHDLTQSGVTLGTFDYISPEQALEPREADVRSDIYSLGCTFYHVLTGQPPVPEGTAAKKLHHHQLVKPLDPRQLVPDLPDAVAVVLDRMMAKNPRERYQSPDTLVSDLQAISRDLGAVPNVRRGAMALERNAGWPTKQSPIVIAALAALAVIALVFILNPSMPSPTIPAMGLPREENGKEPQEFAARSADSGADRMPTLNPSGYAPITLPTRAAVARYDSDEPTAAGLLAWLAEADTRSANELEVVLAGDITFTVGEDGANPGAELRARKITIHGRDPTIRPVIKLTHHSSPTQKQPWAALSVAGADVTVSGLRFVIDALGANYEMMGLRLIGRGRHVVKNCEFVQVMPSFDRLRLTAVLAESSAASPSSLRFEECAFLGYMGIDQVMSGGAAKEIVFSPRRVERGGQDAITRRGPVEVTATNCVFGPHAAAVRLEGTAPPGQSPVTLSQCSILAGSASAVFELSAMASADVIAELCLISRSSDGGGGMGGTHGAVLIRQLRGAGSVAYRGRENRYYNLDAFWAAEDDHDAADPAEFQRKLKETGGEDLGSRTLDVSPWQDPAPLKVLETRQTRAAVAFRQNDSLADLRVTPDNNNPNLLAGAQRVGDVNLVSDSPREPTTAVAAGESNTRIVDSDPEKYNPRGRIYQTLAEAVSAAAAGEVILLRATGPMKIASARLDKPSLDVTIKPAPGCKPELSFADAGEAGACLFDLKEGQVKFEDLSFHLQPTDGSKVLSLVKLSGTAHCTFKNCVITLESAQSQNAPALGAFGEADIDNRAAGNGVPQLSLDSCFIRGDGDVIHARSNQSFDLQAKNTVAVLTGCFVNLEASTEAPGGQLAHATLNKVTTYLTQHLLRLQAGGEGRGMLPLQCDARGCLFVAAASKSLVHLDGPETSVDRLKDHLIWTGERNAYGNLKDRMFDQLAPGD
ncbi:MAG: serine/threonine-protein kinase, partial [Candidatus Acidiferrum sp.]